MKEFTVTVKVIVNTVEDVAGTEIAAAIQELLNDFDGGAATVENVK